MPAEPEPADKPPPQARLTADIGSSARRSSSWASWSCRPDLVPSYANAARLQDGVARSIAEGKILTAELGVRLSKAFGDRREAACRGVDAQVHRATLRGREGRSGAAPGIRGRSMTGAMGGIASSRQRTEFAPPNVDLCSRNSASLARARLSPGPGHLTATPQPARHRSHPGPSSATAAPARAHHGFIGGSKITALSPFSAHRARRRAPGQSLFRAYLKQMLRDGFFHADPHPGNVFLVNGRIALIDLGMVAHLSAGLQDRLLQLLLAIADNRSEDAAKTLLQLGELREEADQAAFQRGVAEIIAQHQEVSQQRPQVGRAVLMLLKVAGESGIRLPPELAMIGKTLNLDESASRWRQASTQMLRLGRGRDYRAADGPRFLARHAFSALRWTEELRSAPARARQPHPRPPHRQRVPGEVDAIDEARLMEGMQKVVTVSCSAGPRRVTSARRS
jgi:hypothetical protein